MKGIESNQIESNSEEEVTVIQQKDHNEKDRQVRNFDYTIHYTTIKIISINNIPESSSFSIFTFNKEKCKLSHKLGKK